MTFDLAIVGGGPAGASCASFAARAGLKVVVLERETFPREKVCGDCLNPACWPVLRRLNLEEPVRASTQGRIERVDFIGIDGRCVSVELPDGAELAVKRSFLDQLLLNRAAELGAEVHQNATVTSMHQNSDGWTIHTGTDSIRARVVVGADGRNSSVARLLNLLPRTGRERVALQAHVPVPASFGARVVIQSRPEGYSGQAPVGPNELNVCLVARPAGISSLKQWAVQEFHLSEDHAWRTITPLTRASISPAHRNLFFIGDAARVVEPFTGEGIFYALASGELAAQAIVRLCEGESTVAVENDFIRAYEGLYRGRLWINRIARAAVLSPRMATLLVHVASVQPAVLRLLTAKIVR